MASEGTQKQQLRGSLEIVLVTLGLIIGGILSVVVIGDLIGDNLILFWTENYGPNGLFNLGVPDIFWVLGLLIIVSFVTKIAVSFLMPIVLPFHGFCPHCGVKPLPEEEYCAECETPLYRKRISKFDIKIFLIATAGYLVFVVIWYILVLIVGERTNIAPR